MTEQVNDELRELGTALLSHIDALMPAIEKAIAAEWDRGNYFNGPQFGATIEAFRSAIAAGTQSAETGETLAPSEGCQSGPKGHRPEAGAQ